MTLDCAFAGVEAISSLKRLDVNEKISGADKQLFSSNLVPRPNFCMMNYYCIGLQTLLRNALLQPFQHPSGGHFTPGDQ